MIQLNLLPDVKMEYIKAQRQRRLVISVAVLVSAASIVLLVLLLGVDGLQHKHLNDLTNDISTESQQLKAQPNIGKILTVQNQLESLTALHAAKPAASRLLDDVSQVTPASVNISNLSVDFTQYTMVITGTADSLASVNQYVDTLKQTTYTSSASSSAQPAFGNVVLSSFGLNTNSTDSSQAATYTINLSYNQSIFDITQNNVKLNIPNQTITHLSENQPSDLFKTPPASTTTTGTSGGSD